MKGKHYEQYRRKRVFEKGSIETAESDIKLLGVVLTGTAEGLKALKGQPYIRAAVLGAIVDHY